MSTETKKMSVVQLTILTFINMYFRQRFSNTCIVAVVMGEIE